MKNQDQNEKLFIDTKLDEISHSTHTNLHKIPRTFSEEESYYKSICP